MTALRTHSAMRRIDREAPASSPGQAIGLMGGTFNPPHQGHIDTAVAAMNRLRLDQVWWLVTPGNPLKSGQVLPPLQLRLAASRQLARDPRIIVTGFEADLATPYTFDTLRHLTHQRPATRFIWIMGADNLAGMHRWHRWSEILPMLPLAVVDRPGWHLAAMASKAAHRYRAAFVPEHRANRIAWHKAPAWTYLSVPQNPLSSTRLRREDPTRSH